MAEHYWPVYAVLSIKEYERERLVVQELNQARFLYAYTIFIFH